MRIPVLRNALLLALFLGPYAALAGHDMPAPEAFQAAREGVRIIDIRTPEEWRQTGVPPGAGRVDFYRGPEVLLNSVLQLVDGDKDAPIVLICRTGNRTAQAQKFLQARGFTQVHHVGEGMAGSASGPGWLKRRLPVEPCRQC
jgi:rhodanese-related sulfurtransferase